MISVLTLTYRRKNLLEEAICSYLKQDYENSEMVIINDDPNTTYNIDCENVKIFNLKNRFDNISQKLKWGFDQCKYEYIYRLDDDDLLCPNALSLVESQIKENPGYEIYRRDKHYYFVNNKFVNVGGNVNNGNVYTKKYLNKVKFTNKSFGEDFDITFKNNGKIHESVENPTMIYRWGMNTYHVSGMGDISQERVNEWVGRLCDKIEGNIDLEPKFTDNYYNQLK
jgi:glycosyltransferase involved in cell wall biosynthesis